MAHEPTNNTKFVAFVAIDFGTGGTCLAYSLPTGEVHVHERWIGNEQRAEIKPKTRILLNRNGKMQAFGQEATDIYTKMLDNSDLMLFERFKMALYDKEIKANPNTEDEKSDSNSNLKPKKADISDEITAIDGTLYSSEKIFVEALKYLKHQAFEWFEEHKLGINKIQQVQWYLTVPAIWSDKAKDKMEQWCHKSGIIDKSIPNHLQIVYEPDCASLSVQYEILEAKKKGGSTNLNNINFNKNETYILVDAGGGTCDIACHEVLHDSKNVTIGVKEIYHPSGGPWGSTYIDDKFVDVLQNKILTKQRFEKLKKKAPGTYVKLLENFRTAKETFGNDEKATTHTIALPPLFMNFIEKEFRDKFGDDESDDDDGAESHVESISFFDDNSKGLIKYEDEFFVVHRRIWEELFFDPIINPIISHIEFLLSNTIMKDNCNYLCLVGGLSTNKYFQNKIESKFGKQSNYKLEIIIPKRPILSVVHGAARYPLTNNYVKERVLPRTYGISTVYRYDDPDINIDDFHEEFLARNTFTHPKYHHLQMLKNVFEVFAHKGQTIYTENTKAIKKKFRRPNKNVKESKCQIHTSDEQNPKCIITEPIATIMVRFPDGSEDLKVICEFHFEWTQFRVVTYPEAYPNRKTIADIHYQ